MSALPPIDRIMTEDELRGMSSLALAHIGDAVFELLARTAVCESGRRTAAALHRATVGLVAAPAQARAAEIIEGALTDEERAVLKRGRNARPRAVPRGSSFEEYHLATALEALFGYLYLKGEARRIKELFDLALPPRPQTRSPCEST
jgi:ribonuclease-3 family protein